MKLIEEISNLISSEFISQAAIQLNESENAIAKSIRPGMAGILAFVLSSRQDKESESKMWDLIQHPNNKINLTKKPESVFHSSEYEQLSTFITLIPEQTTSLIHQHINRSTGFSNESSSSKLISFLAPVLFSFLKNKTAQENFGKSGLMSWLSGNLQNIKENVSSDLLSHLNIETIKRNSMEEISEDHYSEGSSNWWVWLIGLLTMLGLMWFVMKTCNKTAYPEYHYVKNKEYLLIDSTQKIDSVGYYMEKLDKGIKAKWDKLGKKIPLTLPGNKVIQVPEKGMESAFHGFIVDTSRKIDKKLWFHLDRILFDSGTTKLNIVSLEQLRNIAAIVKAYPTVALTIIGHTDDLGNDEYNKKLSTEKAEAVMKALIKNGVEYQRMSADGHGKYNPIADNNSEEGREKNRRVSIRVSLK